MSKGIGAHANKVAEDDHTVIYEYGGYNLNDPEYLNKDHIYDGTITIQRDCLAESEIHEKLKKTCQQEQKPDHRHLQDFPTPAQSREGFLPAG